MSRRAVRTIYLLKRVEVLVKGRLEEALQDFGVTPGQYTIMTLVETQREVSSAALARQAGVTPQSISETIAGLKRKGLIERSENPANRRVLRIGLTKAGQMLLQTCDARVDQVELGLFAGLGGSEIDALREALGAILQTRETFAPLTARLHGKAGPGR